MNTELQNKRQELEMANVRLKELREDLENFEPTMDDDDYEEMLDEIYGDVEICGMAYSSGRALKELDPVAFRCGKSDYLGCLDVEEYEQFEEYRNIQEEIEELESDISDLEDEIADLEIEEED